MLSSQWSRIPFLRTSHSARWKSQIPPHRSLQPSRITGRHDRWQFSGWSLIYGHTFLATRSVNTNGHRSSHRSSGQFPQRIRHWNLFRDGCPGGEAPEHVSARADPVVSRVRAVQGNVLLFTSGHFMRVLTSRWLGLEPNANSRYFMLSTASLSALGYENELARPVIRFWNDTRHVERSEKDAA